MFLRIHKMCISFCSFVAIIPWTIYWRREKDWLSLKFNISSFSLSKDLLISTNPRLSIVSNPLLIQLEARKFNANIVNGVKNRGFRLSRQSGVNWLEKENSLWDSKLHCPWNFGGKRPFIWGGHMVDGSNSLCTFVWKSSFRDKWCEKNLQKNKRVPVLL